jgi:hypothetical protein
MRLGEPLSGGVHSLRSFAALVRLVGCALVLAFTTSCIIETKPPTNDFRVVNRTEMDLKITVADVPEHNGGRTQTARAGVIFHFSWEASLGDCYGSAVIAADPDGNEVARLDQPICRADRWIFEANGRVHLDEASG